ncbi:MAG: asparaginase [Bacteroidales bacterium]|nr:asparaginase [Bacteroidales bacterium]MCF8458099.1 asparaginase [Bacteroidales bacterium]
MNSTKTPSVLIIYTGGTIGMVQNPATGALQPFDFAHILKQVPELKSFGYRLDTITFNPIVDSSNASPAFWVKLVKIIKEKYNEYDGFVILHGTDTMAYSASALSFMLRNQSKPVIFTGSQLPIGQLRTDGKENLITAIEIAAASQNNQALVPEVCIFFENQLFRGNRTTKYNAEHFDAFQSDNYPRLAKAGINIKYNYSVIHYPTHQSVLQIYTKLDANVAVLKIFPGITKNIVEAILNTKNLKALVLETFGSGNAPTNTWFVYLLKKATKKGIIILNVTQCSAGSVEMGLYETSVPLLEAGVISGYDSTTEAAITKLMFLLGNKTSRQEIVDCLNQSISGEITV